MGGKKKNYSRNRAVNDPDADDVFFSDKFDVTDALTHRELKSTGADDHVQHLQRRDEQFAKRHRQQQQRPANWQPPRERKRYEMIRKVITNNQQTTEKPKKGEFRYVQGGIELPGRQVLKGAPPKPGNEGLHAAPPVMPLGPNRIERNRAKMAARHGQTYEPKVRPIDDLHLYHKADHPPPAFNATLWKDATRVWLSVDLDDLMVDGDFRYFDNLPKPTNVVRGLPGWANQVKYEWDMSKVDRNKLQHALNGNLASNLLPYSYINQSNEAEYVARDCFICGEIFVHTLILADYVSSVLRGNEMCPRCTRSSFWATLTYDSE